MRKAVAFLMVASLAAPSPAREWRDQPIDVRPGAFVGVQLSLSARAGQSPTRPRAALAIAPTQSRISGTGMVRTGIGQGIALNLTPNARPSLTLAGVRADTALGLKSQGRSEADRKLGLSTGATIAIGVGAALLVGGAIFLSAVNNCEDHDDEC